MFCCTVEPCGTSSKRYLAVKKVNFERFQGCYFFLLIVPHVRPEEEASRPRHRNDKAEEVLCDKRAAVPLHACLKSY